MGKGLQTNHFRNARRSLKILTDYRLLNKNNALGRCAGNEMDYASWGRKSIWPKKTDLSQMVGERLQHNLPGSSMEIPGILIRDSAVEDLRTAWNRKEKWHPWILPQEYSHFLRKRGDYQNNGLEVDAAYIKSKEWTGWDSKGNTSPKQTPK